MRKISITEALNELKLYDSKIMKAITNAKLVGAAKKSSDKVGVVKKEDLLYEINRMKISTHTMYRLLWHLDSQRNSGIKNMLFYVLFNYKNDILTELLNQYDRINTFLIEDKDGEIVIYNRKFAKKKSPKAIFEI